VTRPAGATPRLNGSTHVNLTVRDLDASTDWYCRAFGFTVVRDAEPEGSGFTFRTLLHRQSLSSIVLGRSHLRPAAEAFDEHRVGLHHLGYHVPERADLQAWAAHLSAQGIEHTGVRELFLEAGYGIWLRDPDGIWLELYWMNADYFFDRLRQQWRAERHAVRARANSHRPGSSR
jgi:glyoxylase I family protein